MTAQPAQNPHGDIRHLLLDPANLSIDQLPMLQVIFDRVGTRELFTPEQQRDRARKGMAHMSKLFNAAGLTTVHNAGTSQDQIQAYEDCRQNGELTHRASMMIQSGQAYTAMKLSEWDEYHGQVTDWERSKYLEMF